MKHSHTHTRVFNYVLNANIAIYLVAGFWQSSIFLTSKGQIPSSQAFSVRQYDPKTWSLSEHYSYVILNLKTQNPGFKFHMHICFASPVLLRLPNLGWWLYWFHMNLWCCSSWDDIPRCNHLSIAQLYWHVIASLGGRYSEDCKQI